MSRMVVGVGLGDRESLATVLSLSGDVIDRFTFHISEEGYALFARRVPKDARVAFEATTMAYPFSKVLKGHWHDVTVAHPKELEWIVMLKKNDRIDSLKIAKLHLVGMLPKSYLLDREEQVARNLLIQRVMLGVEIGRLKNRVISYLKREGVYQSLPKTDDSSSLARREAMTSLRFNDDRDLVMRTMMDRLEFLKEQ